MVSDFCKKKHYQIFATFWDKDKNGAITTNDVKVLLKKTREFLKWDEPRVQQLQEFWLKIFRIMLEKLGKSEEIITLEEWFSLMQDNAENPDTCEWGQLLEEGGFSFAMDKEKSGITAATLEATLTSFGMPKDVAKSAFSKISPNKSVVDRATFKVLWRQYMSSDDPKDPGNYVVPITT